jgi:quinol monooxygenase YgiN
MQHVMAVITYQPAHADTVKEALSTLASRSRAEPGCLRYEVFQRIGEPVLVTQESWADEAAEQAHMAGPNVAAAVAAIAHFLAAPPAIHKYTALT